MDRLLAECQQEQCQPVMRGGGKLRSTLEHANRRTATELATSHLLSRHMALRDGHAAKLA